MFKYLLSVFLLIPFWALAQNPTQGKPIPPPEAARNTNRSISARFANCSGTTTINGCNGTATINKTCLQADQYFSYAYYHTQWGNLACFARNCLVLPIYVCSGKSSRHNALSKY